MYENQSEVVIEMAKSTIDLVKAIDPAWRKAYLRFYMDGGESGANGSYANASAVNLLGTLDHAGYYGSMHSLGEQLFRLLQKERGVLLLAVDANFDYEIKFDWTNLDRWRITKLNGSSGVPEGL